MNRDPYDDKETLRDARGRYFEANNFGADGGYSKKVEVIKFGPIPLVIPNPQARVRALQYHDLHHVLTGYRTDLAGEFEISAYELGAGCGKLWFAWVINLMGVGGALFLPRRAANAWARGRVSRGLYRRTVDDAFLDRAVGEVRRDLELDREVEPTARDWFAFLATGLLGLMLGLLIYLGPPVALIWSLVWWLGS